MGWFKVDDNYFDNLKVEIAGDDAAHLNLRGIAYCSRNQTDGKIPFTAVPKLWVGRIDIDELVESLLDAGLWKKLTKFYVIHDYLEHQSSRAQIRAKTESAANRKRKSRAGHTVTGRDGHTNVRAPEAEAEADTQSEADIDPITPGVDPFTTAFSLKTSEHQTDEVDPRMVRELFGGIGRRVA